MKNAALLIALSLATVCATAQAQPVPMFAHPKLPPELLEKLRTAAGGECIREAGQLTGAERRDHLRKCAETKKQAFQTRAAACERDANNQPAEQRQGFIVSCMGGPSS